MKNFNSFEDFENFGYRGLYESIPDNSDWAAGAEGINIILASEEVATKMEMQVPTSIVADNTIPGKYMTIPLIWNVSNPEERPNFYLRVTLSQYPDLGAFGYNVSKVEKIMVKVDTSGYIE
jgi:hypothetical protein